MRRRQTNATFTGIPGILVCVVALAVTSLFPFCRTSRPGLSCKPIEASRVVRRSPIDPDGGGVPRVPDAAVAPVFLGMTTLVPAVVHAHGAQTLPAVRLFRLLKRIRTGGRDALDLPSFS
jgi:hypothetical protein